MPLKFNTTGIPAPLVELWEKADRLWETQQADRSFESYASADYYEVFGRLKTLTGRANTFLEFGSGLGIVTIMASWLGFEAYGIESKDCLVEHARDFAKQYSSSASFATGSFIPNRFEFDPASGHESVRTFVDEADAYDELNLDLSDFDLIYAYPWPTEHALYNHILQQHARPGAIYMWYDAREGIGCLEI